VLATLAATVTRYIALSSWVFRRRSRSDRPDAVLSLDTRGN
jgi:putative flippase GtrA